jgi:HSP20 family protein
MATLQRWDPFRDLLGLQNEMTRLFSREAGGAWTPALDVNESADRYTVYCELPGVKPDQVDVTVNDGVLTIRGERKFYEAQNEDNFHRVERRFGAFQRTLTLPAAVDAGNIAASFADGLLTITIPKAETAKPRRIEVKATSCATSCLVTERGPVTSRPPRPTRPLSTRKSSSKPPSTSSPKRVRKRRSISTTFAG